ncbi:MAG TPA: DUF3693 domain-containing protein [Hyphomicrobiales bacterium]|nr:DUF3693 domain-containing protein [Hyphomicrobiales bacterium]
MNTLNKLLDKARKMCERDSDNALAIQIGVTRATVSKWRKGGNIAPEQLARLIDLAQADPAIAVLVMQEQEAGPAEHRMWSAVWDRLSPVTTVIGVALMILPAINPAAVVSQTEQSASNQGIMHIMSNAIGWIRRAWTALAPRWNIPRGIPA